MVFIGPVQLECQWVRTDGCVTDSNKSEVKVAGELDDSGVYKILQENTNSRTAVTSRQSCLRKGHGENLQAPA